MLNVSFLLASAYKNKPPLLMPSDAEIHAQATYGAADRIVDSIDKLTAMLAETNKLLAGLFLTQPNSYSKTVQDWSAKAYERK